MSTDAEVARLLRAMGEGSKPAAHHTESRGPISPRGATDLDDENLEGLSKEEARLLRSMHTTTGKSAHPAPAKKWADAVTTTKHAPPPENVAREQKHQTTAPATEEKVQPAVEHHHEPRHARPNHPEEEALVEVVADPEAVKRKEEEQAEKEAARMERLLAKRFIA